MGKPASQPNNASGAAGDDVLRVQLMDAAGNTSTGALTPQTSGGLLVNRLIGAATTNATNVKATPGQVYGIVASNINAAVRYLKLYNKATAPTVGTDTPVMTIALTGGATGPVVVLTEENGIAFSSGIGFALTTGVADADTAAVAANEQVVHILYK